MSRKKPVTNKRLLAAQAAHDKFLRGLGLDPSKKPTLHGVVDNPMTASSHVRGKEPKLAHSVPANGTKRDMLVEIHAGREEEATLRERDKYLIGPAYNKGGYTVLSRAELGDAKRRDR